MTEGPMYCQCQLCEGDFTNADGTPVGACDNEADDRLMKIGNIMCMQCRDGSHVLTYRVFCETLIYARDEEQAAEIGYQVLHEEDYQVERMENK